MNTFIASVFAPCRSIAYHMNGLLVAHRPDKSDETHPPKPGVFVCSRSSLCKFFIQATRLGLCAYVTSPVFPSLPSQSTFTKTEALVTSTWAGV